MPTPLQMKIIETLKVKPVIDAETEFRARVDLAKELLVKNSMKGYVLGISGGLDSCLSGYILQKSCSELRTETGEDYKFIAMLLPYGIQGDAEDAKAIVSFIGADRVIELNIKPMVDAFTETYNAAVDGDKLSDFNRGNFKARARCSAQYAVGSENNLLVGGSENICELMTGFFTKSGGDGSFDFCPISDLTKSQEVEILEFLNAPPFIITKAPTADLLDGDPLQTDEEALGVTYAQLNSFLMGEDMEREITEIIEQRFLQTEHKRRTPITPTDIWWK